MFISGSLEARSGLTIGINWNLDRSLFRFVTMHAFDRRTDERTDGRTDKMLIARPRLHFMQRGKNDDVSYRRNARV